MMREADNLLIGGKAIAGTHIINTVTRFHYGEWGIAAAGGTAGWLLRQDTLLNPPDIAIVVLVRTRGGSAPRKGSTPAPRPNNGDCGYIIPQNQMPKVQQHLRSLGQWLTW